MVPIGLKRSRRPRLCGRLPATANFRLARAAAQHLRGATSTFSAAPSYTSWLFSSSITMQAKPTPQEEIAHLFGQAFPNMAGASSATAAPALGSEEGRPPKFQKPNPATPPGQITQRPKRQGRGRQGLERDTGNNAGPQRPRQEDSLLRALARLSLSHETQLTSLRADSGFMVFMNPAAPGLLAEMLAASRAWKAAKAEQPGSLEMPLRQALFLCLMQELKGRLQLLLRKDTPAMVALHDRYTEAKWLQRPAHRPEEGAPAWAYLQWCPTKKELIHHAKLTPIVHDQVLKALDVLTAAVAQGHLHRFHSTRPLDGHQASDQGQVAFIVELSLRADALPALAALDDLSECAATQMIGSRIRRERIKEQPAAAAVRALLG